jgi:hypothetical protein
MEHEMEHKYENVAIKCENIVIKWNTKWNTEWNTNVFHTPTSFAPIAGSEVIGGN